MVADRMAATRGTLAVLKAIAEGPADKRRLMEAMEEVDVRRGEKTLGRYLKALEEAGYGIEVENGAYGLRFAPIRLPFGRREALAAISALESMAEGEPVYGEHFASAARKIRAALPENALEYVERGDRIGFDLDSAGEPPEDPDVLDVLRRASYRHERVKILYYSYNSGTLAWRTVEPIRIFHKEKALRLKAHDADKGAEREFRVGRIKQIKSLGTKFAPEAHTTRPELVWLRLNEAAFDAHRETIIPDEKATVKRHPDGSATIEGQTPEPFWTVRHVAALGPAATVLGGPKFKERFLDFLHETLDQYS